MKIAVFSDIHGNYEALKSIITDIKKRKIDQIICLGDVIGLGPSSNECVKLINDNNIKLILGNHELYYKGIFKSKEEDANHDEWIKSTIKEKIDGKEKYVININDIKVLFIHYFYKSKNSYESFHLFDEDYKQVLDKLQYNYVFYGHLHTFRKDKINNKYYYCLDSSGCLKDDKTFYYIITINDKVKLDKITLKYDRDSFINKLNSVDYPDRDEIALKFYDLKIKDVNN